MKNDIEILKFLADDYSRMILAATVKEEKSALQLSEELDIPIATVYRKIKSLEDAELIKHVKTIINISGNEEKYYKSNVGRVSLTFSGGRLFVKVEKEDYSDKFVRLWKRLSK